MAKKRDSIIGISLLFIFIGLAIFSGGLVQFLTNAISDKAGEIGLGIMGLLVGGFLIGISICGICSELNS